MVVLFYRDIFGVCPSPNVRWIQPPPIVPGHPHGLTHDGSQQRLTLPSQAPERRAEWWTPRGTSEDVAMKKGVTYGAKMKWGMPSQDGELDKKMKKIKIYRSMGHWIRCQNVCFFSGKTCQFECGSQDIFYHTPASPLLPATGWSWFIEGENGETHGKLMGKIDKFKVQVVGPP